MSKPEPRSTLHLIESFRLGGTEAGNELARRHGPALLARARSHSGMHGLRKYIDPEDVVAEVFVRALCPGRLEESGSRGRGSVRRLLLTILDRVFVDMRRRYLYTRARGRDHSTVSIDRTGPAGRPSLDWIASRDPTPSQPSRELELKQLLQRQLSERERTVWELHTEENCPPAECARRLGTTSRAISGVLARIRKRLREQLGFLND